MRRRGREEFQSYYFALKLLAVSWNMVSGIEIFLRRLSLADVSYIFLHTWIASIQLARTSVLSLSSTQEHIMKGMAEKNPPLVCVYNLLNKLCTSFICQRAHSAVAAIPVMGVLFFSLSTSVVKSSFRNRKPMMENR